MFFALGAAAQIGTVNPIDTIRQSQDYRLLSNLFPQAGPTFDPERDRVMPLPDQADASSYLTEEFNLQKQTLAKQVKSVLKALVPPSGSRDSALLEGAKWSE